MVVVPKIIRSDVRDLTRLNDGVNRRYYYPILHVDVSMAKITEATIFSKFDANHGYWSVPLYPSCRDITTVLTPFRRFRFLVLPFVILSAPEDFQQHSSRT